MMYLLEHEYSEQFQSAKLTFIRYHLPYGQILPNNYLFASGINHLPTSKVCNYVLVSTSCLLGLKITIFLTQYYVIEHRRLVLFQTLSGILYLRLCVAEVSKMNIIYSFAHRANQQAEIFA